MPKLLIQEVPLCSGAKPSIQGVFCMFAGLLPDYKKNDVKHRAYLVNLRCQVYR